MVSFNMEHKKTYGKKPKQYTYVYAVRGLNPLKILPLFLLFLSLYIKKIRKNDFQMCDILPFLSRKMHKKQENYGEISKEMDTEFEFGYYGCCTK